MLELRSFLSAIKRWGYYAGLRHSPSAGELHLFAPLAFSLHRLRLDKETLSPGLVAFYVEAGIVQQIQNAEAAWRPKIGVIIGQGGTLVVMGGGDIATKIVSRVRFYEERTTTACPDHLQCPDHIREVIEDAQEEDNIELAKVVFCTPSEKPSNASSLAASRLCEIQRTRPLDKRKGSWLDSSAV